jgi:ABC-2 type transport system ATP-binding protein
VFIHASDSDSVARYLLSQTAAKDLEITARALEDAFIALTSDASAAMETSAASEAASTGGAR